MLTNGDILALASGVYATHRAGAYAYAVGNARNLRSRGDSEGADIWLRVAALLDQSAPAEPLRRACAG